MLIYGLLPVFKEVNVISSGRDTACVMLLFFCFLGLGQQWLECTPSFNELSVVSDYVRTNAQFKIITLSYNEKDKSLKI